ncbi:MAG: hypothetical protein ACQ5SW_07760 [Sphaerochaetaceae bacterium]
MEDLFDDPGDLGFFNQHDEEPIDVDLEHDEFYEPAPGEEEY